MPMMLFYLINSIIDLYIYIYIYITDLIFVPNDTVVNNKLNERVITRLNGMAGLQQQRRARRQQK
jgi:hypothetical protein